MKLTSHLKMLLHFITVILTHIKKNNSYESYSYVYPCIFKLKATSIASWIRKLFPEKEIKITTVNLCSLKYRHLQRLFKILDYKNISVLD